MQMYGCRGENSQGKIAEHNCRLCLHLWVLNTPEFTFVKTQTIHAPWLPRGDTHRSHGCHLAWDLACLWHSECPAFQMRSPLSDPGSRVICQKTPNEARWCAFSQDREHVFQFCKEKATWEFMFSLHLAPTSITPNVCGAGKWAWRQMIKLIWFMSLSGGKRQEAEGPAAGLWHHHLGIPPWSRKNAACTS